MKVGSFCIISLLKTFSRKQFNDFNSDSNDYVSWQEIVDYYKSNASVDKRLDRIVDATLKICDRNQNKAIDRFEVKHDDCWEELEIRTRFDKETTLLSLR